MYVIQYVLVVNLFKIDPWYCENLWLLDIFHGVDRKIFMSFLNKPKHFIGCMLFCLKQF